LRHFIDGALYDAKDEYADAILEYQEALAYDSSASILYAIARDYGRLGKADLAVRYAREAIRREPNSVAFREGLAQTYIVTFQMDSAIQQYEAVVRLDSNYVNGWFNLARLLQSSKPLRALEIYEHLLENNGDDWEILLQCAEIYTRLGKFDTAAEMYERMFTIDPSNRMLLKQLAVAYTRAGKSDRAIKSLELLLEQSPNDPDALATMGEVYLEQGKFEKAVALFQRLQLQQKSNFEIELRIGVAYFGQIQKDSTLMPRAREIFEKLTKQAPNDWRPYFYLGAIAGSHKQDSLAAANFEQVTRLAEWNPDGWYYLGTVYFEKTQYLKTIELMNRAVQIVPKDYRLHFLQGIALSQLQRRDESIESFRHALALNPKDINSLSSLALALDGMARYTESDSLYELALKLEPENHLVLNNFGYSLCERGLQMERAMEMAQKAVAAQPDNSSYNDTLGWIYYLLGNYVEAEKYVAKSVASGDASAVVLEHLGDIYFKLGKKDKAFEWWKKASEKNPGNAKLKDKIDKGIL
jgi:tetratricopeptide (TPR) repeat protein